MSASLPRNQAEFTVEEIVSVCSGQLARPGAVQGVGVCTDTRQALAGAVFVALRGERFDAHAFLEQAQAGGATVLVVEACPEVERLSTCEGDASIVVVQDTTIALGLLARAHRRRWGGKLVGVAGSAGKTTTRAVLETLARAVFAGRVHATHANLNNRIGVPLTLLGLTADHELAIVEIGTNRPGEVEELSRLAEPDVAILTLVDLEHTEGLSDLDGVEEEEGAIFSGLAVGGVAIANGDDPRALACLQRAAKAKRRSYGHGATHDLQLLGRALVSPRLNSIRLRLDAVELQLSTSLLGPAAELAVGAGVLALDSLRPGCLDASQLEGLLTEVQSPGRAAVLVLAGPRYLIDDSYNSNPGSLKSSIRGARELADWAGGRLHLVLGEMLELGALSVREHRLMGEYAAQAAPVTLVAVQGDAEHSVRSFRQRPSGSHADAADGVEAWFAARPQEVATRLASRVEPSDVVLVKGSRGVRVEHVVEDLARLWGTEA